MSLSPEPTQALTPAPLQWRPIVAFLVILALTPAAALGGGMGMAPLVAFMALAALPLSASPGAVRGFALVGGLWLAFAGFAALSALWSVAAAVRPELAYQAGKVFFSIATSVVLVAAAAKLDPRSRRIVRAAGVGAVLVLIVGLAVEAQFDMPFNRAAQPDAETGALLRNPGKGASILTVLVWGLFGALVAGRPWERGLWKLALLGAGVLAFQFGMNTNMVGFGVGLGAALVTYAAPRFGLLTLGVGIAGWLLAAPFATQALISAANAPGGFGDSLPQSWQMRLDIWQFTLSQIWQSPLIGQGLDAARTFGEVPLFRGDLQFQAIPLHPHSWSLHLWLEVGAVGVVLGAAAILATAYAASVMLDRNQPQAAAAAAGSVASFAAIWNVSYGAWQEWWMAIPGLAVALAVAARR